MYRRVAYKVVAEKKEERSQRYRIRRQAGGKREREYMLWRPQVWKDNQSQPNERTTLADDGKGLDSASPPAT